MSNATQATIALFLFVLIGLIIVSLSRSPAAALFTNNPEAEQPVIIQSDTELQPVTPTAAVTTNSSAENGTDAATIREPDLVAHTVESGETLWRIAQRYNTSVDAIMAQNPELTDPTLIKPGQILVIPQNSP